jgi:hypothetical protein
MRLCKKKKEKQPRSKLYRVFENFVDYPDRYKSYSKERYRMVPVQWMRQVEDALFKNGPTPSPIPMSQLYRSDGTLRIKLSRCLVEMSVGTHFQKEGDFVVVPSKLWHKLVAEYGTDGGEMIARNYPFIYYPQDIPARILKELKNEIEDLQEKIGRFFKKQRFKSWDVENKQVRAFMYRFLLGGSTMKRAFKSEPTDKMILAWCKRYKRTAVKAAVASKDKRVLRKVLEHHSHTNYFYHSLRVGDYKLVKGLWTPADHDYAMAVVNNSNYEHKKVRAFIEKQEQLISATSLSDDS